MRNVSKRGKFSMKHWLLFVPMVAVALSPGLVSAQDTAYKALRTIGAQRGEKALNQVISISGQSGRPQPVDWRITLDDPTAHGGVRELDIVSGQISSERTPARPSQARSRPIDLTKLNLDSDGAFHSAEREASRNQVGFDSANYQLAADSVTGQPVWTVEVFDYEQRAVGTVRIAAGNGTLVSSGNWVPQRADVDTQQRRRLSDDEALAGAPTSSSPESRPPADYRQPEYQGRKYDAAVDDSAEQSGGTVGERANRYGAAVAHFGQTVAHRTTRVFQTVGGWFQEKFTGRNTIDPKHGQGDDDEDDDNNDSDQPPPPSVPYNRSAQPADAYSRPVTPAPPD
jgi:hypothetical protein